MAAAYDALVSLMNTIEQIKNHALISTFFFKEQIESVGQRVEFLLDFIAKYSSHGGNDGLEKQIASAANKAEGVIESHVADQIRAKKRRSSICLAELQNIIEEMDCIKEEIIKVKEERRSKDEQRPACSISAATTSRRPHQTRMVGFDEKLRQLMDVLTREESSRQIISVVGMGGIGKSILVRNVHANLTTANHFDVRAWASVTHEYSVRGILIDLLVSFKQKAIGNTVQELGEMLHKSLFGSRYLIVLDDVWDLKVWDEIQLYFPDNNTGSRIVLTTRLSNVAINLCDSSNCFRMNLLDEYKSWILFCETVFGCEDCPPELEEVGKEISKQCKGLPLSIVVVGGFLRRSNKTVESWNNVAKNINSVLMSSDEDDDCYKILSLSYSQLDVHLKPCFVCMGIFEEGREIRASRIINVWVAGGLIKPNGVQTLEEIAEGYLNELVDRNLIVVGRQRLNGKIGSCLLHDLIRDVCKRKSEEDEFFCVGRALGIGREGRIIYHEFMPRDNTLAAFLKFLRGSYIWFALIVVLRKLPLRVVYRLLRVLNMADSSLESIFKNLNLRFLTYQPSDTYKSLAVLIPPSVSLIWNLQTLDIHINGHVFQVVAPLEIWNLQQLRHVYCNDIYIPDPPPNVQLVVLEKLQTLITVVNLRLSEEVCKRIPNVNKLYVAYDSYTPGFDHRWCDHLHNLGSLHKLRSLKLVSSPISFLTPRSSIRAGWRKCTFPTSLKKLKLINCCIDWNDLTIIGSLPHLEVLKLHDSMKGQNWSPEGEFGALKVLSIVNCDLRCWNADSSHFPVLKRLFLEELRHLAEIPLDIGEIPTLELIRVLRCSSSAHISAAEIKKEQEKQGNEGLRIQISTPFSLIQNILSAPVSTPDCLAFRGYLGLCSLILLYALYQISVAPLQSPGMILHGIFLSAIVFSNILELFFKL